MFPQQSAFESSVTTPGFCRARYSMAINHRWISQLLGECGQQWNHIGTTLEPHWNHNWLVGPGHPSEKYERQLGWWDSQYFWENAKNGNQTTNQTKRSSSSSSIQRRSCTVSCNCTWLQPMQNAQSIHTCEYTGLFEHFGKNNNPWILTISHMEVSWNRDTPGTPQIVHFNGILPYKPSIWDIFLEPPICYVPYYCLNGNNCWYTMAPFQRQQVRPHLWQQLLKLFEFLWTGLQWFLHAGIWRFPEMGVPQIIHFNWDFPLKTIHLGIPPFMETPIWRFPKIEGTPTSSKSFVHFLVLKHVRWHGEPAF